LLTARPARLDVPFVISDTQTRSPVLRVLLRAVLQMEARAGIEPTYTDLQSAAWPLCHRALEQIL
jgi:hypothetical protein